MRSHICYLTFEQYYSFTPLSNPDFMVQALSFPTNLLHEASLSTSTAYLVMTDEPKRIGLKSIDALLTFFTRRLGHLETSDLIEFEFEDSAES